MMLFDAASLPQVLYNLVRWFNPWGGGEYKIGGGGVCIKGHGLSYMCEGVKVFIERVFSDHDRPSPRFSNEGLLLRHVGRTAIDVMARSRDVGEAQGPLEPGARFWVVLVCPQPVFLVSKSTNGKSVKRRWSRRRWIMRFCGSGYLPPESCQGGGGMLSFLGVLPDRIFHPPTQEALSDPSCRVPASRGR